MKLRSFGVALAAMLFAAAVTGQSTCPHREAKHVPESFAFYGNQSCSGTTFSLGGATVTTPGQNCPVVATYSPPSEFESPTGKDVLTKVQVVAQAAVKVYHFSCQTDWYVIVPWGSSCRVTSQGNGATLLRLVTTPC